MKRKGVVILVATGMAGVHQASTLSHHLPSTITTVTGSESFSKKYSEAVRSRGGLHVSPEIAELTVKPTRPCSVDSDFGFSSLPTAQISGGR